MFACSDKRLRSDRLLQTSVPARILAAGRGAQYVSAYVLGRVLPAPVSPVPRRKSAFRDGGHRLVVAFARATTSRCPPSRKADFRRGTGETGAGRTRPRTYALTYCAPRPAARMRAGTDVCSNLSLRNRLSLHANILCPQQYYSLVAANEHVMRTLNLRGVRAASIQ